MLNSTSFKTRFLVSVVANTGRSAIAFITGLIVARGLSPSGYGDYSFLLGSFIAIRSLLEMGSSSAFYTFISQKRRPRIFFLAYFAWLAIQFVFSTVLLTVIMPQEMINKVWLGHSRDMVFLAFAAAFMQQQVWLTINQIAESMRKTVRFQIVSIVLVIAHLVLVSLLLLSGRLSMIMLFWLIIGEYILAAIFSFRFLRQNDMESGAEDDEPFYFKVTLDDYKKYCKPLILLAWIGFVYEFADRWMLQRFGGAGQQGFYQIAYQFSSVSLLATSSILNVFWKDIAEANGRGDKARVALMYHKVNRGLVMFGAILSGLLIPWTEQIVRVFLGQAYLMAVPVLMIMFLHPIFQSMGQIGGTMLLASGYTHSYTVICTLFMIISLPLSYLAQAPPSNLLPGLGLGAMGMALKMVLLTIFSVNVMAWVIARRNNWKYNWTYQVIGISAAVGSGFLAKWLVSFFSDVSTMTNKFMLIIPFLAATAIYAVLIAGLIWMLPWLVGMNREEIRDILKKMQVFQS